MCDLGGQGELCVYRWCGMVCGWVWVRVVWLGGVAGCVHFETGEYVYVRFRRGRVMHFNASCVGFVCICNISVIPVFMHPVRVRI